MQLLEFKRIGKEKHLTFESIQRFVFDQYSEFSEAKARQHLTECSRCYGIYESLVRPGKVREKRSYRRTGARVFSRALLIMSLGGIAGWFIYFGGTSDLNFKSLSDLFMTALQRMEMGEIAKLIPLPPELGPLDNYNGSVPDGQLKDIDAPAPVEDRPKIGVVSGVSKTSKSQPGVQEANQPTGLREIYGKITTDGAALQGVTVMVPGGSTAKVSDSTGQYYIQVPKNIASLVFIYRGKQTVKELDPASRKRDVSLNIEDMIYPEIEAPEAQRDVIVSN